MRFRILSKKGFRSVPGVLKNFHECCSIQSFSRGFQCVVSGGCSKFQGHSRSALGGYWAFQSFQEVSRPFRARDWKFHGCFRWFQGSLMRFRDDTLHLRGVSEG